jgi:exosortase
MRTLAWLLPLCLAYVPALWWCVERWNAPSGYFEHGYLVAPIGIAVVWWQRAAWRTRPAAVDPRGWWLLGPALLLHLAGVLWMIDSLSAASLCLAVPGAAWLALGRERLRGLWPVLGLVLFAVPAPIYVEGRAAFVLKEIAVQGGAWLGNLLGAGIVRSGANLHLTGTRESLFVAEACSGLRSLLSLVLLGYCQACFLGNPGWLRRAAILLTSVPIAVGANVVRIASLCVLARVAGVPFAEGHGHTLANTVEWLAALGALLGLDWWLWSRLAKPAAAVPSPAPVAMPARTRRLWPQALPLWLLAGPLLFLGTYRPPAGPGDRAERLPVQLAGCELVPRTPAEARRFEQSLPRWRELLGTPDFVWRRYRRSAAPQSRIQLVALFHDSNWKSVHPPRICIEGSDMDIEQDDVVPAPWLGTGVTAGRILARARADGVRYLTLSLFGTRDWASGSYTEFTMHHLPRAFWRANESGFLLRVETPLAAGEDLAVAEARCGAFLAELLPAARELLR